MLGMKGHELCSGLTTKYPTLTARPRLGPGGLGLVLGRNLVIRKVT